MSSVELTESERRVLPSCTCMWSQKIITHANRIIDSCKCDNDISVFFDDCERNIKNIDNCRMIWNNEVHSFSGDECHYICFFRSELLNAVVKLSVSIDILEEVIVVGNMTLADKREISKLDKHLNTGSDNSSSS